jgi:hypothetical protein
MPGEHAKTAPGLGLPYGHVCNKTVHRGDEGQVAEAELRWRHIFLDICDCPETSDAVHALLSFRKGMSGMALHLNAAGYAPVDVRPVSQRGTKGPHGVPS